MKNIIFTLFVLAVSSVACFAQLQVKEAKLGKGVENRLLTEESTAFATNSKIYLWMKLSGGTGNVTVTWKNGTHTHSNELAVSGNPWRTWAYATAYYPGNWTVSVTDDKGTSLKEMAFTVQ
jgi:hypothetical protein